MRPGAGPGASVRAWGAEPVPLAPSRPWQEGDHENEAVHSGRHRRRRRAGCRYRSGGVGRGPPPGEVGEGPDSGECAGALRGRRKKGALNRGLGVASANVVSGTAGRYTVFFKRGVRKCAYEATLGTTGFTGVPPVGEVSVVAFAEHKAAVFVRTVDSTGNPEYLPFHLVVACPPL